MVLHLTVLSVTCQGGYGELVASLVSKLSHYERMFLRQVVAGDQVIIIPVNAAQPLHVSSMSLSDYPGCREVNAIQSPEPCPWKLSVYMDYNDASSEHILKSVRVLRLTPNLHFSATHTGILHCYCIICFCRGRDPTVPFRGGEVFNSGRLSKETVRVSAGNSKRQRRNGHQLESLMGSGNSKG